MARLFEIDFTSVTIDIYNLDISESIKCINYDLYAF